MARRTIVCSWLWGGILWVGLVSPGLPARAAQTWTGKLVDAGCADQAGPPGAQQGQEGNPATPGGGNPSGHSGECAPNTSTTAFAIRTEDGRVFKLDQAGNAKAAGMIRNKTDKGNIAVRVTGTLTGGTIRVQSMTRP
jgi:hypothetical protein